MLGSAIPIPVLGTLIGGAIGFYIGDLLYTLFRGGGVKAVVNKLKEDLKKVFNVGKAIFNWSKTGLGRLWEGLPKVFGVPNPAWLFNPLNMVAKAKLIGKAFFSRDPMKEEKDKKDKEKKKTIDRSNQPKTQTLLESGKRGNIEQALYNMRLNASKGSGEAFNDGTNFSQGSYQGYQLWTVPADGNYQIEAGGARGGRDMSYGYTDYWGAKITGCLLYTSPSPRDKRQSRMPSSA